LVPAANSKKYRCVGIIRDAVSIKIFAVEPLIFPDPLMKDPLHPNVDASLLSALPSDDPVANPSNVCIAIILASLETKFTAGE
jgi:hypothetical protein